MLESAVVTIARVFVASALALLACKERPNAPLHGGYDRDALGALHVELPTCSAPARESFRRGLLALHSFWYEEASKQFEAAIGADAKCSMAYWGLAMSKAKLLWGDDDLAAGRDALTRMPDPHLLPLREQAWVMAALALFRRATLDVRSSRQEFLAAMEQLHVHFPDDESATFLAVALLATLRPNAPDELALRKRAAELAGQVFARNRAHPGAAHYLIHAYDTPDLAKLALPAAEHYAKIAPAAFHARHMPAHIYARLGMWKQAAISCQAAWDVSIAWVKRDKLPLDHQDFHSLVWLVEINFERGRRSDADRAMMMFRDAVRAGLTHEKRAAYANQVASYLARTGEWERVDELLAVLDQPATSAGKPPAKGSSSACGHATAANAPPSLAFERRAVLGTRARAAAMRRDEATAVRLLDERDAVDAELRPFLVATQTKEFVASADKLQGSMRAALLAHARGDDRVLVSVLEPLAADQAQEFTGEGTAGGILHREEIADALLRLDQPAAALEQYRRVLAAHAGRAHSLRGAARAATKAGDMRSARGFYNQLLATWHEAEPTADGLAEARKAIGP